MYEYPRCPEGSTEEQLRQLWQALFRLIEALNLKEETK